MASKTLAVKYRPAAWEDLSGQDSIKIILDEQIKTKTFKNGYLFAGASGCGKTTSARIFANKINGGKGNPIEIDAASNSGVDNIREINDSAKKKSIDSEYKIFIVDECFKGDTLVTTPYGAKHIRDIVTGDCVRNMCGFGTVTQVFKNMVFTNRLCCVTIDGVKTYTTVDHLYFTQSGWVPAQELGEGDIVYAPTFMRKLWGTIFKQTKDSEILLNYLRTHDFINREEQEVQGKLLDTVLQDLWERVFNEEIRQKSDLFFRLSQSELDTIKSGVFKKREGTGDCIPVKPENEDTKPHAEPRNTGEDDTDENFQWKLEHLVGSSWWQRAVYNTSINFMGKSGKSTIDGVPNKDKNAEGCGIPHMLQSRPSLSRENDSDRGGWEGSFIEKLYQIGWEENSIFKLNRVESVEVYQSGNRTKCFTDSFSSEILDSGYVEFYDLEVSGHSSYFANGTLVHNCHSLSNSAWQAMLKTLEDCPKYTIFILCTTDPQKIPATVLNRVQRYDFSKISDYKIIARLAYICDEEHITVNEDALQYICRLSNGGMRDAISMLDKVSSLNKEITVDSVVDALGTVNYDMFFDLLEATNTGETGDVLKILQAVHESGKEIKQFLKGYQNFVVDVCKYRLFSSLEYTSIPPTEKTTRRMNYISADVTPDLDFIIQLNNTIKWDSNPLYTSQALFISYLKGLD